MPGEHIAGIVVAAGASAIRADFATAEHCCATTPSELLGVSRLKNSRTLKLSITRRKAIAKSIRIISVEELKKLGEEIFDKPDRPWRQTFLLLIAENPGATFSTHRQVGA